MGVRKDSVFSHIYIGNFDDIRAIYVSEKDILIRAQSLCTQTRMYITYTHTQLQVLVNICITHIHISHMYRNGLLET